MHRPGPLPLPRAAMIAVAMIIWLASATGARASGCHVPDRPALGADGPGPVGEHAWSMSAGDDVAPPVLRRIPCPGETPRVPVLTPVPADAAGPSRIELVPEGSSIAIRIAEAAQGPDPLPYRLDRPPRRRGK